MSSTLCVYVTVLASGLRTQRARKVRPRSEDHADETDEREQCVLRPQLSAQNAPKRSSPADRILNALVPASLARKMEADLLG